MASFLLVFPSLCRPMKSLLVVGILACGLLASLSHAGSSGTKCFSSRPKICIMHALQGSLKCAFIALNTCMGSGTPNVTHLPNDNKSMYFTHLYLENVLSHCPYCTINIDESVNRFFSINFKIYPLSKLQDTSTLRSKEYVV